MRAASEHDFLDVSEMINAYVQINKNPHAEALAMLSRPPQRIKRRQSTDNRPQTIMPPRRMTVSEMPVADASHQAATRAQILEQLQMPGLNQLDVVSFEI